MLLYGSVNFQCDCMYRYIVFAVLHSESYLNKRFGLLILIISTDLKSSRVCLEFMRKKRLFKQRCHLQRSCWILQETRIWLLKATHQYVRSNSIHWRHRWYFEWYCQITVLRWQQRLLHYGVSRQFSVDWLRDDPSHLVCHLDRSVLQVCYSRYAALCLEVALFTILLHQR